MRRFVALRQCAVWDPVIFGEHCCIRAAEPDDAPALKRVYHPGKPRAATLDRRREPILPTTDELRELLGNKDVKLLGEYYAVEDATGEIRGFCCLRAGRQDVFFGEMLLMFIEDADLGTGMAGDLCVPGTRLLWNAAWESSCLDTKRTCVSFLFNRDFKATGWRAVSMPGRWFDETLSVCVSARNA